MAKISTLPLANALAASDVVLVNQGGATKRALLSQVAATALLSRRATSLQLSAGTDDETVVTPRGARQMILERIVQIAASANPDLDAISDLIDGKLSNDFANAEWQVGAGAAKADLSNVVMPRMYLQSFTNGGDAADVTTLVNTILAAIATRGGGVLDYSGLRIRISAADLIIPTGVTMDGSWHGLGARVALDLSNAMGVVLLDPSRTVRLARSAGFINGGVLRSGMETPTNYRQGLDLVAACAGTAITFDGPDACVENVYIGGFQTPIDCTGHERPRIVNVKIDCTGPIKLDTVYDMQHVRDVQRWPFLTTPQAWSTFHAVTGADSNGGLIRLTIGQHLLRAGDKVTAYAIGGVMPGSLRRWDVASTTSTTITLAGSTFSGAYTSGGAVFINSSRRMGRAFSFQNTDDWGQASDSFQYGYDEGWVVDSSDHTTQINNGSDNFVTAADPTSVGFEWRGTANAAVGVALKAAAQGTGFRVVATPQYEKHYTLIAPRAWNSILYDFDLQAGHVSVVGGGIGVNAKIRVGEGIGQATFIGADLGGVTWTYGSGAQDKTRIVECVGQVNQLSPTAIVERAVIRGSGQGGQLVLGYGGNTTNVITQGGPSCWFMDVEYGEANALRFFRNNASGSVLVAARIAESNGQFDLYGGLRLTKNVAAIEVYDDRGLAAGNGGGLLLMARNDTNQAVAYGAVMSNTQNGGSGAEAGSLDLYSRAGGTLNLGARLNYDGAFQMGSNPATVINPNRLLMLRSYTAATLPSASIAAPGATAFVSDASNPVFGAVVVGGGSTKIPVYSDGANWRVG